MTPIEPIRIKPGAGIHISSFSRQVAEMAAEKGVPVAFTFNDAEVIVQPGETAATIEARWFEVFQANAAAYRATPEYEERERRYREEAAAKKLASDAAIANAPAQMTLADPEAWASWLKANTDAYGSAVMRYAETWARLMEGRILPAVNPSRPAPTLPRTSPIRKASPVSCTAARWACWQRHGSTVKICGAGTT